MEKGLHSTYRHAVQWLRRTIGDAAIKEWLKRRKGGGLYPEQLRFWELILHIPRRTANTWIVESNRSPWTGRMAK